MLLKDLLNPKAHVEFPTLKTVHKATHARKQSTDKFISEFNERFIYFSKLQNLKTYPKSKNKKNKKNVCCGKFPLPVDPFAIVREIKSCPNKQKHSQRECILQTNLKPSNPNQNLNPKTLRGRNECQIDGPYQVTMHSASVQEEIEIHPQNQTYAETSNRIVQRY